MITLIYIVLLLLGSVHPVFSQDVDFKRIVEGVMHVGLSKSETANPVDLERWLGTGFVVQRSAGCTVVTAKPSASYRRGICAAERHVNPYD